MARDAQTQPTRRPGAIVFENVPRWMTREASSEPARAASSACRSANSHPRSAAPDRRNPRSVECRGPAPARAGSSWRPPTGFLRSGCRSPARRRRASTAFPRRPKPRRRRKTRVSGCRPRAGLRRSAARMRRRPGARRDSRARHERRVARRDQQLTKKVEGLLRAAGDDDVVGFGRDAERTHVAGDPLAQGKIPLAHRILQRQRGRMGQCPPTGLRRGFCREQRRVGNPAGEGDSSRPVQKLEQFPDLGSLHPPCPFGVAGLETDGCRGRRCLPGAAA